MESSRPRHTRFMIATLGVLLLTSTAASGCSLLTRENKQSADLGDGVSVTLTSPSNAEKNTLTVTDPAQHSPAAAVMLGKPVRIEGNVGDKPHSISFSFEGARTPAGADPATDLTIVVRDEESKTWIPVGGTINVENHTITAETTHFSEWGLSVTDPNELRNLQRLREMKPSSQISKYVIQTMYGEPLSPLKCDANLPLVAAHISGGLTQGNQLCVNYVGSGLYRLSFTNDSELPYRFTLQPGAQAINPAQKIAALLGQPWKDSNAARVGPHGEMTLLYLDSAADKPMMGTIDGSATAINVISDLIEIGSGMREPTNTSC